MVSSTRQVIQGMDALQTELRRLSTLRLERIAKPIAEQMVTSTKQRFIEQHDPQGNPWTPLSPRTVAKRLGGSKAYTKKGQLRKSAVRRMAAMKILIDTADLMNSIQWNVKGGQVAWGTNKDYAKVQNFGGPAGRGLAVNIPARTFMGISSEDQDYIIDVVTRHVSGGS
ncbi:phage virion morphogenesis protein [Deinococcus cellulosilyticus]|uniref:Phage virion morphogenesis protein n=1 Tax=Deinococcus cellulosilyticus (strain DSM 18568 / NBRC 106333 / KACC 11606 / 5516J-15) TaxID=1223518 RepID=A0A511NB75_DEIC1|nr:phage virion morphogenesis protein [Deinococcus cellulosilyticus]GEM50023.1 hypothetical protein DC3_56580 [Deinococcus cellulosilyticus NBRC 106333 = KACC 11606]